MLDCLIIFPTLNENAIIERSVRLVYGAFQKAGSITWQILVADNGSTDETRSTLTILSAELGDAVGYRYLPERGRGRTIRAVVRDTLAECYLYLDADVPTDPAELVRLVQMAKNGEADVIAVRRRSGTRPLGRRFLTLGARWLSQILFRLPLHDPQAGIKVFRQNAIPILLRCREENYFMDTEFLVRARRAGLQVEEESIAWLEQRYPERRSKTASIRDAYRGGRAFLQLFLRLTREPEER